MNPLQYISRIRFVGISLSIIAAVIVAITFKYFGDNAETNHAITYTAVTVYFNNRRVSGTITPQETADFFFLKDLYSNILAWTCDGTTWTFPWELVP